MEVQRLASDATLDDVLKWIYIRCLPQQIVTAITSSLGGKLRTIINAADKAWAAAPRSMTTSVLAIAGPPPSTTRRGGRGGRQSGTRATGQMATVTLCNFHRKFGDAARKCAPGCSHWAEEHPRQAPGVFQVEEELDGEDSNVGTTSENS